MTMLRSIQTLSLDRGSGVNLMHKSLPPRPVDPESTALVVRAQTGDQQAIAELYARYRDTVFRFVYFRVHHRPTAEDLSQEAWVRALRRLSSYQDMGKDIGAWLVTIARNIVADHFKSGRYRLEVTIPDVLDGEAWANRDSSPEGRPESIVVDHLSNVELLRAVQQLNPEQQQCIVLRFLRGYSVAETAAAMGKQAGATKALQYRAVRTLARLLPDGFDGFGPDPEAAPRPRPVLQHAIRQRLAHPADRQAVRSHDDWIGAS